MTVTNITVTHQKGQTFLKPHVAESTFGAKNENCDSLEAAEKCETDCETVNLECLVTCDSDTSCLSQCSREFLTCVDNCPCFTNCYEVNYGLSDTEYTLVRKFWNFNPYL